ncbi:MAG: iron ABC transporter permease, partial [Deltaproteobacteria bacterium]
AAGRVGSGGVWLAVGVATVALLGLYGLSARLNLLSLGDDEAAALGVRPAVLRTVLFVLTSLLVACAVAFTGLIGFVGLVVPHLVRLALGADHRLLIPACTPVGAAFLVGSDALARGMFPWTGAVLPVGAVTAVLGAPLFFALLIRSLRRGEGGGP